MAARICDPAPSTATTRRDLRRRIRNRLGVSRDDAPNAYDAISAAADLAQLLSYATDGRVRLVLQAEGTRAELSPGDARMICTEEVE